MRPLACFLVLLLTSSSLAAATNSRPKMDLRGHNGGIVDIDLHPNSEQLISISTEPGIFVWSLKTGRKTGTLMPTGKTVDRNINAHAHSRRVEAIRYSPDGKLVAEAVVAGGKGQIILWDPETGKTVRVLHRDARNVRTIAYAPDGKMIAANVRDPKRNDHIIVLLDAETGKQVGELRGDRLAATMLAFSDDGKTLVSAGGRQLHVWDVATRKQRHAISTHKKTIFGIGFSPDNKHFASCDAGDEVRIWDAEDGTLVSEIEHKQDAVYSVAFSGTGNTVATGGKDGTIKLWSTKGKHRKTLWGHANRVTVLRFNADNDHLASGSRDGIIGWWEFDEPDGGEDEEEDDPLDDEDWRDMVHDDEDEQ